MIPVSGERWYEPWMIRYTRNQIIWGIDNMYTLKEGYWPDEPEAYYTDQYIKQENMWLQIWKTKATGAYLFAKKRPASHADFEAPLMFSAEIEARLSLAGGHGNILVNEIESGVEEYDQLSYAAKMALNYISGQERRKISFPDFLQKAEADNGTN